LRRIVAISLLGIAVLLLGCSHVPPCTVSPIEIEETREDVKVLDQDLAKAKQKEKELKERLAKKKKELAEKKPLPEELRKKLERLKKGSGRS